MRHDIASLPPLSPHHAAPGADRRAVTSGASPRRQVYKLKVSKRLGTFSLKPHDAGRRRSLASRLCRHCSSSAEGSNEFFYRHPMPLAAGRIGTVPRRWSMIYFPRRQEVPPGLPRNTAASHYLCRAKRCMVILLILRHIALNRCHD